MIRLNLGCGSNLFAGWTNVDHIDMSGYIAALREMADDTDLPAHQATAAKHARAGNLTCMVGDIRQPLPQADATVDAIYLGQVVEHLNPLYQLPKLLAECHRVLKPGAPLRITTPSLDLLIAAYQADEMMSFAVEQPAWYVEMPASLQLSMLMYGSGGPDSTNERYEGHHCCYSKASLAWVLQSVGFRSGPVTFFREAGQTEHPELFAGTQDFGCSHSLICEVVR